MDNNIYVLNVDMENKNVEDIALDAAVKIVELFDKIIKKQEINRDETLYWNTKS